MTAGDLMALLSKMPRSAPVKAWDADSGEYEDVTGALFSDDGSAVILQTDDIS
jgi:hypothetical protein